MKLERYSWRCTSFGEGLLQNNPATISEGNGPRSTGKTYDPEVEAEKKSIKDKTGFYIEPIAFRNGIIYACIGKKIRGRSMKAIITPSIFFDAGAKCYLYKPGSKTLLKKYEIDSRRVVVKNQAIIRHRPYFPEWETEVGFLIDMDNIADIGVIDTLFQDAGYISGVGDFRVSKGGWFGRYEIKRIS